METLGKHGRHRIRVQHTPEELVVAYHERTKHHFLRYAASSGYMDWATQPDPYDYIAAPVRNG